MNKVDVKLEIRESNLRDEIEAWKDASGLEGVKTPEMLKRHIANFERNISALDKSSAITIQQRDRLFLMIQGMKCKNIVCNTISFFFGTQEKCGHCDVCIAQTEMRNG